MRVTKTQSRTPPTRPYPLHKKIKILFLGGYVYDGTNSTLLDFYYENVCLYFCVVTIACYGPL